MPSFQQTGQKSGAISCPTLAPAARSKASIRVHAPKQVESQTCNVYNMVLMNKLALPMLTTLLIAAAAHPVVHAQDSPASVIADSCPPPIHPAKDRQAGQVVLRLLIAMDGRVVESQVTKGSASRDLDKEGVLTLIACRYKPAYIGGKPIQSWLQMRYPVRPEETPIVHRTVPEFAEPARSLNTSGEASPAVHRCINAEGRVTLTNAPCPDQQATSIVSESVPARLAQFSRASARVAKQAKAPVVIPANSDLYKRMKSCDGKIALAAALEVVGMAPQLDEPIGLFLPSMTIFHYGEKNDGIFWFYVAQLRAHQQLVLENGDRGQVLSVISTVMGAEINNFAFKDTTNLLRILDKVAKWDADSPNPFRERAIERQLSKEFDKATALLGATKAKLIAEKDTLEAQARNASPNMIALIEEQKKKQCL
jgi:TonB family protein